MDLLTLVTIIMVTVMVALGMVFLYMRPFKHRIRIKQTYGNKNKVVDDKFKEVRHKDGVFWRLLGTKETLDPAPDEVIEIGNKGRMVVTCYEIEKGCYVWQKDDLREKIDDKQAFINKTQPLTTTQRSMYMSQAIKAEREKKKTTAELIAAAAPTLGIIMIVTVFLLFFGDAIKPIKEMASTAASTSDDFKRAAEVLAASCRGETPPVALNAPIPDANSTGSVS